MDVSSSLCPFLVVFCLTLRPDACFIRTVLRAAENHCSHPPGVLMRSLASPPYTRVEIGNLFVTQEQLACRCDPDEKVPGLCTILWRGTRSSDQAIYL